MKLSELIARCQGDPELAIEDRHGIPRPVVDIDFGVKLSDDGQHGTYVVLESARDEDD
jgi:hypothetical protein